jgi:hypothetical protein
MIEVVPAAEGEVFVPPEEIGKPTRDSNLDGWLGKGGFFFAPRAIAGSMYYSYKEIYDNPNLSDITSQDYIPFLGAGITLGYKNFSLDFYARRSASGKDNLFNTTNTGTKETNSILLRKDYGINLNYQLGKKIFVENENIVFSVGYKVGRSDISGMNRNVINGIYYPVNEEKRFETSGPTIGIAYGYPIGDSSVLGINLAYAKLTSSYTTNDKAAATRNAGDTSGLTIGVTWSGAISNELGYSLSVDAYSYSMTGLYQRDSLNTEFNIEESVVTAKASISYAFDLF